MVFTALILLGLADIKYINFFYVLLKHSILSSFFLKKVLMLFSDNKIPRCLLHIMLNTWNVSYCPGNDKYSRLVRRTVVSYTFLSIIEVLRTLSSKVIKRFHTYDHLVEAAVLLP